VLELRAKKRAAGQTMVEFMISVIVIAFFLFLMLSLAILLVTSEYMEYAAFMAARTYRTGYSTEQSQRQRADLVARQYIANVLNLVSNGNADVQVLDGDNPGAPRLDNAVSDKGGLAGVQIRWRMPLFYLPPIFAGTFIDPNIDLVSESYYGRDPSAEEACDPDRGYFRRFLQGVPLRNADPGAVASQMEDNGC
jgi:hypothetical protein